MACENPQMQLGEHRGSRAMTAAGYHTSNLEGQKTKESGGRFQAHSQSLVTKAEGMARRLSADEERVCGRQYGFVTLGAPWLYPQNKVTLEST